MLSYWTVQAPWEYGLCLFHFQIFCNDYLRVLYIIDTQGILEWIQFRTTHVTSVIHVANPKASQIWKVAVMPWKEDWIWNEETSISKFVIA